MITIVPTSLYSRHGGDAVGGPLPVITNEIDLPSLHNCHAIVMNCHGWWKKVSFEIKIDRRREMNIKRRN